MDKFRILLLNSLDIYGGGEFYVHRLAKSLKLQGHTVWVSCRDDVLLFEKCKCEQLDVFPVAYPANGKSNLITNIKKIKNFALENNVQIIHSNTNYDRTAGAFAAYFAKAASVATVHSFHSISHNLTHWFRNKYLIDAFIADSKKIKELLVKKDNIATSKVFLVNIGINPDNIKRREEAGIKTRNELSIPSDAIVIGNVGRMVEFKGQEFLIRAFAESLKECSNLFLIITGDGKLKNNLLELVENLDVKRNIRFTGFRNDLDSVYSAFDIYAHTSLEGGGELFPISVLNALAQGLPVLASDAGDISSMVINGKNGYLVKPKDVTGISARIIELAKNRQLRSEFGKTGNKFFTENFTEDKMTAEISAIYGRIINK